MIKAGIVGATGYTGVELLRLLAPRPDVELLVITSREQYGRPVATQFPNLRGHVDLTFSAPNSPALKDCDVVFFATPHTVAMTAAAELLEAGVRVIDLSADFRITDVALWESWYRTSHLAPHLVEEAVYGLPEVNRALIRQASLVAVPGCYPTAVQLGFLPLIEAGCLRPPGSLPTPNPASAAQVGRQSRIFCIVKPVSQSKLTSQWSSSSSGNLSGTVPGQ